jgi:predicted outer membrane protein
MLRRIPRFLRYSVLGAVLVAVALSVFQSWSSGAPGTGGWTQTQWGPVGPADRDLLAKVRQAGLWEQPTGQQAEQMATSPEIREVGRHIAEEHGALDAAVRQTADKLGVLLPTTPSALQQGWMAEISAQTGSDYDRVFVQRLREAHGIVLPLIAQVRVSTRNSVIREFADTANTFVSRHIGYLEGTGLVDYSKLPDAPSPGLLGGGTGWTDLLVPLLVFVGALLAAVALIAAMRSRGHAKPRRVATPRSAAPRAKAPPLAAPVPALPGPRSAPGEASGPYRPGGPGASVGDVSGPHRIVAPDEISLPYNRATSSDVTGPYRRPTPSDVSGPYRRPALGETTGARRIPPAPGETTGSRRRTTPAPGDVTGPRHSVRR